MCTAITFYTKDHYFGRTLDLEYSYAETVTVTPRSFPLVFRHRPAQRQHLAIIGMAYVADGYPLYYDAVNEAGLGMAGLNFPQNARYFPPAEGGYNIAPFEFVPWILGQCRSVAEARDLAEKVRLTDEAFSPQLPPTPLHWMISDREASIVVEQTQDGLRIYDNPVGVMTNNPPFPVQLFHLNNYMGLSPYPAENRFCRQLHLEEYSRGMGGLGLPGDLSSASRFVRAAFTRLNAVSGEGEKESVGQFFHILGSVEQQRGCVRLPGGCEITRYTSCCNLDRGVYYYTTYDNHQISAVDLYKTNLAGDALVSYPLVQEEQINYIN